MHGGDIYSNKVEHDFSVNISPGPMPQFVREALVAAIDKAGTYPDILNQDIREKTGRIFNIDSQKIVYGNGASEIIMGLINGLRPDRVMVTAPCFTGYENAINAGLDHCQISYYDLDEKNDFALDAGILDEIKKVRPELVILTNPNNPNGRLVDFDLLKEIVGLCRKLSIYLLIDECFLPLSRGWDKSFAGSIKEEDKIIILRAFTKSFGVPGVRIGYGLCSNADLCQLIRNHLPEWNISVFASGVADACLDNLDYVKEQREIIDREREFLSNELKKEGIKAYISDANYILFYTDDLNLKEKLLKDKILIRDCSDIRGLHRGFYRIAVRGHQENIALVSALKKAIGH
ncbi:MAG: aminotransferase class I/II-fold pyridoxal phosphate-dependent enzyme [Pseudobutyrivibrio sp.]|nr:aminotransferase class I/II-fold pyridoxal phosphate-dependent enzyme [Pseudobutyrivibrio sp.]